MVAQTEAFYRFGPIFCYFVCAFIVGLEGQMAEMRFLVGPKVLFLSI